MPNLVPADYTFPSDLPADIATRLRAADEESIEKVVDAAYAQLDFPDEGVPPRAESLTPPQLALAKTILECSLWSNGNRSRMPPRESLRLWLGLEPPGPLEEMIDLTLDDEPRREPMWRAIQLAMVRDGQFFGPRQKAILDALPLARRYELWGRCNLTFPAPWSLHDQVFFPIDTYSAGCAHLVNGEGGAWAASFLDQLLEARKTHRHVGSTLLPFLVAVRAKIHLEPRWDVLLPISGLHALVDECVLAIPPARRVAAILTWLSQMRFASHTLKAALRILPQVPDVAIVERAIAAIPEGGGSKTLHLRALREACASHPELLVAIAAAESAAGPPLVLTVVEQRSPTEIADLSPEDQAQLLIAGKRYHGKTLSLDALMSDDEERSLRFELTYLAIGDAKGKHLYDAWLYMVDSGCIFARGKTRVVAERVQRSIECKDARLADALEAMLREPPRATAKAKAAAKKAAAHEAAPAENPARKKAAPKKGT